MDLNLGFQLSPNRVHTSRKTITLLRYVGRGTAANDTAHTQNHVPQQECLLLACSIFHAHPAGPLYIAPSVHCTCDALLPTCTAPECQHTSDVFHPSCQAAKLGVALHYVLCSCKELRYKYVSAPCRVYSLLWLSSLNHGAT